MMEILHIKNSLLPKVKNTFLDKFQECVIGSKVVYITTGFFSVDSILYLEKNISILPKLNICIGMHHFDGFTASQYNTLVSYDRKLREYGKGIVYVCVGYSFHGKVYTFIDDAPVSAIMGSSNLSQLTDNPARMIEVDIVLDDQEIVQNLFKLQKSVITNLSIQLSEYSPRSFRQTRNPVEVFDGVIKLGPEEFAEALHSKSTIAFRIPVKTELKSGINAHHAKGRLNKKTGLIKPRPWYEVEMIVPKEITELSNYPRYCESFAVVTDDGYKFDCCTGGDYSKNFRSKGNLSTLGAWMKGKLESEGILTPGELVTRKMLIRYGNDTLLLTKTNTNNLWLLEFKPNQQRIL